MPETFSSPPFLLTWGADNSEIVHGFDAAVIRADELAHFDSVVIYALDPRFQFDPQEDGSIEAICIPTGEKFKRTLEKH